MDTRGGQIYRMSLPYLFLLNTLATASLGAAAWIVYEVLSEHAPGQTEFSAGLILAAVLAVFGAICLFGSRQRMEVRWDAISIIGPFGKKTSI